MASAISSLSTNFAAVTMGAIGLGALYIAKKVNDASNNNPWKGIQRGMDRKDALASYWVDQQAKSSQTCSCCCTLTIAAVGAVFLATGVNLIANIW